MRSLSDPRQAREAGETSVTLDELYRRHAEWLGTALRRRFGAQLSHEDLVQETYARLVRATSAPSVMHPRALLWRIANRVALDQLRRYRRADGAVAARDFVESCDADQAESVLLGELIRALPQSCRDTFVLSRFAGLSYEEIARRQSVSVKTIEWRISRALEILTRQLAE